MDVTVVDETDVSKDPASDRRKMVLLVSNYFECEEDRKLFLVEGDDILDEEAPSMIVSEVKDVIQDQKKNKGLGQDGMMNEVLLIAGREVTATQLMLIMFNMILMKNT